MPRRDRDDTASCKHHGHGGRVQINQPAKGCLPTDLQFCGRAVDVPDIGNAMQKRYKTGPWGQKRPGKVIGFHLLLGMPAVCGHPLHVLTRADKAFIRQELMMLEQEVPELMCNGKADPAFMAVRVIDQDGAHRPHAVGQQHALTADQGRVADLVNIQLVRNILYGNRSGSIRPAKCQNPLCHDLRIADIAKRDAQ